MGKIRDLKSQKFGRLSVLYDTGERRHRQAVWHCRCDCGNEVDVTGNDLIRGHTKSCSCYKRERAAEVHTVHGASQRGEWHPVYLTWRAMLQRCENPHSVQYYNYGGRSITVCPEWHDAEKFISWALANGWEKGLTLDRINNNGNYEPDNCRWTTRKEQAWNKRNNHLIIFNGKAQPMSQWAEEINISLQTLSSRINQRNWSIERALTESVREKK